MIRSIQGSVKWSIHACMSSINQSKYLFYSDRNRTSPEHIDLCSHCAYIYYLRRLDSEITSGLPALYYNPSH